MVSALMVERMPETSSHNLGRFLTNRLIAQNGEILLIGRIRIMFGLKQHRHLTPSAGHTAVGVLGIPVVHVVAPLTDKISLVTAKLGLDGTQQQVVILVTGRSVVASGYAIRIGILFTTNLQRPFGKRFGIMGFVENRFPEEQRSMVAMDAYHIANIRIDTLGKYRFLVPELPSRYFDQSKQTQFVACIHKSRINDIMGTDNLQTRVTQFLGIPPLQ